MPRRWRWPRPSTRCCASTAWTANCSAPAPLRAAEPELREACTAGLRVGGDGILYAPNAARWLLDHPPIEQRRAQVVEVDGARVRLQDGSWLSAQAVILAGGIHVTELCPELPVEPKKGHLLITDRYPGASAIPWWSWLRHQRAQRHGPLDRRQYPAQADRPVVHRRLAPVRHPRSRSSPWMLAKMLRRAMHYMPGLANRLNGIRAWTGFRAASLTACRCSASTRSAAACGWRSARRPGDHRAGQRRPAHRPVVQRTAPLAPEFLPAATLPGVRAHA